MFRILGNLLFLIAVQTFVFGDEIVGELPRHMSEKVMSEINESIEAKSLDENITKNFTTKSLSKKKKKPKNKQDTRNNKDKIEIISNTVNSTKTSIKAEDGVVVYYDNSVINAQTAIYNRDTKLLVLTGQVEVIGYQGTKEHSNRMEIQTDTKEVHFEKLFLANENDVWLLTDKARKSEGNYTLGAGLLSPCEANNPLWKLSFTDSKYSTETQYIKLYNAKMYFLDVPIFYLPFMAFSTNNDRSTGFLSPSIGYALEDGLIYEQPFFWNISPSMDLELNPQYRTKRSTGIYSTFRFVDSNVSSGKLRMGYFKDKKSYTKERNLPNDTHYGVEFNYGSSNFLKSYVPKGYDDGLYVNTTFLNDIDYRNLQRKPLSHFGWSPLQQSKINYYLQNNKQYMGINAKYFIDTRKENNDKTVQILPSFQWHKYLKHIIWENLTYSVDAHVNNFYRKTGSTLNEAEFRVPIEFTTSFFDDYLNISLGEEFYYSKYFFGNESYVHDEYQYHSTTNKAKIYTDLTKDYNGTIHVLQPSIEYVNPGNETETPVIFSNLMDNQKELFSVGLPEEQYRIGFKQFIYDENMTLMFFQRLSQVYYPNRDNQFEDLNNEMGYYWEKWSLYNNLLYSYDHKVIREMSSSISLKEKEYKFSLSHSFKQALYEEKENITTLNALNFRFGYAFNANIDFSGALNYDLEKSSSTQWKIGTGYHQDCWSITTYMRQDIVPRPEGITKENSFGFQLNFIPFGGFGSDMFAGLISDE
jgi:LPS-assembly protein